MSIDYERLAYDIHDYNCKQGWWGRFPTEDDLLTKTTMVFTELAEAIEADRKELMDSHLPHRQGREVELADALIRMLDICGRERCRVDVDSREVQMFHIDVDESDMPFPIAVLNLIRAVAEEYPDNNLVRPIEVLLGIGSAYGLDIELAMFEKLRYNEKREDHKPENRAKPGGKKY